jgi:hypothetical protein
MINHQMPEFRLASQEDSLAELSYLNSGKPRDPYRSKEIRNVESKYRIPVENWANCRLYCLESNFSLDNL